MTGERRVEAGAEGTMMLYAQHAKSLARRESVCLCYIYFIGRSGHGMEENLPSFDWATVSSVRA